MIRVTILAIYLYLKSKEAKLNKIKINIIRTLSYQIGENRILSIFEIDSVIKSKLREGKFKESDILNESIIEDLVSETISNPLIEGIRKKDIIDNLKSLHIKNEIFNAIEKMENDSPRIIKNEQKSKIIIDKKNIISANSLENIELNKTSTRYYRSPKYNYSSVFISIAGIFTLIITFVAMFVNISGHFVFAAGISSALVSMFAAIISMLIRKYYKAKK